MPYQHNPSPSDLQLRRATGADLDNLTKIAQAGFPDDPEWNYRFPYRYKHPEDNWKWTRKEYEEYLDQPGKYSVLLATLPAEQCTDRNDSSDGDAHRTNRISIALAVWDVSVTKMSKDRDGGINERKDANPQHIKEFTDALDAASEKYFSGHGERQLHLWLLTTHPDFRRLGAGSMLTRWGMDVAGEKGWPVTVLASPMGDKLYQALGFKVIGNVTVQVDGEEEKLVVSCLQWIKRCLTTRSCDIM
ncbi:hypothetical protein DL771_012349 [Monosporascus sp. 5C6A]|nr:hypothetical protein DL771_012349 [Monosporascus sp. 5C6A]